MTTVAAIDCGTNAIRLLIATRQSDGSLRDDLRQMETVRLGEGVDETGAFNDAALARTFAACDEYVAHIARLGVQAIRFVATSAARDASNRDVFIDGIRQRLAVEPEVITGAEEADLSFTGAAGGLPDLAKPALVVDIGGGSTEFVIGVDRPTASWSTDMGCVRMTERHLFDDPPSATQIARVERDVSAAIDQASAHVPFGDARSLVGLAGTVTTVAAMALDLPNYDADRLHGAVVPTELMLDATQRLIHMSRAQRAALPFMHPGRVDVIGGGALVLAAIMTRVDLPNIVVSEHDLLDGIALSLLK